jgi:hypothetical protein
LAVAILVAYVTLWGRREVSIQSKLAKAGTLTEGQVINKETVLGRSGVYFMLKYRFEADGKPYENDLPISKSSYDRFEVGQPIGVHYLPRNPKVSRPVLERVE